MGKADVSDYFSRPGNRNRELVCVLKDAVFEREVPFRKAVFF